MIGEWDGLLGPLGFASGPRSQKIPYGFPKWCISRSESNHVNTSPSKKNVSYNLHIRTLAYCRFMSTLYEARIHRGSHTAAPPELASLPHGIQEAPRPGRCLPRVRSHWNQIFRGTSIYNTTINKLCVLNLF